MSCTVLALPYALAWVVGAVVTAAISSTENGVNEMTQQHYIENKIACENVPEVITDKYITEREFETPFVDKELLEKTLEEHGATKVNESGAVVVYKVDNYTLTFRKASEDKPYILKVACLNTDNADEKLDELNSEYAMNVQENAYLQIVDRLKNNNMQIESEEVSEDNTIVLTINID